MRAWVINRESVSSDFLEGEVVAIHLGTGVYYSLRGPAAGLWQALAQPRDAAGLAELLLAQFDVPADIAGKDAAIFLERLLAEGLICPADRAETVKVAATARAAYSAPEIERFADLQDLLLLDPIHDVGAQGWPSRPAPPEAKP